MAYKDVFYHFKLNDRVLKEAPVLDFNVFTEATVVVNILVDEYGNVVQSNWGVERTTGDWSSVLDKTLQIIRNMKFNRLPSAEQLGINHYREDDYLSNPEPQYQAGEIIFKWF